MILKKTLFNRKIIFNHKIYDSGKYAYVPEAFLNDWFFQALIKDGAVVVTDDSQYAEDNIVDKDEYLETHQPEATPLEMVDPKQKPRPKSEPKSYKTKPNDGREYRKGKFGRGYLVTDTDTDVPAQQTEDVNTDSRPEREAPTEASVEDAADVH